MHYKDTNAKNLIFSQLFTRFFLFSDYWTVKVSDKQWQLKKLLTREYLWELKVFWKVDLIQTSIWVIIRSMWQLIRSRLQWIRSRWQLIRSRWQLIRSRWQLICCMLVFKQIKLINQNENRKTASSRYLISPVAFCGIEQIRRSWVEESICLLPKCWIRLH